MSYPRDPFSTPEPASSQPSFQQPYRDVPTHSNPDNQDFFDADAIPVSDTTLLVTLLLTCRFFPPSLSFTSNSALRLANVVRRP